MKSREADGFVEFVHARWSALVRYAYLLCGNTQDAEDLVQTTLTRFYSTWPGLRSGQAAESYARIAIARNYMRLRARRPVTVASEPAGNRPSCRRRAGTRGCRSIVARSPCPASSTAKRHRHALLPGHE